jgi:hypothetical protein
MNDKNYPPSLFMVMDGRQRHDPDRAMCLVVEDSLKEAKSWLKEFGDAVVVETKRTDEIDDKGRPIYSEGEIVFDPQSG